MCAGTAYWANIGRVVFGASCVARREDSGVISLDEHLSKVEASLIDWALAASEGNKSKAAELLLISRSTLGDRIRRLRRNPGSVSADPPMVSSIP